MSAHTCEEWQMQESATGRGKYCAACGRHTDQDRKIAPMTDPTPTPPELDLAALTVIANAATPGPWLAKLGAITPGKKVVGPREASDLARGPIVLMQPIFWDKRSAANADHMAAFDPPTVLALIARVEQLAGEHDELRSEIGRLTRERDEWESNATEESAHAEAAEARTKEAHESRLVALERAARNHTRAETAEAQVARVRELARAWAQRGEHTMKYAATCPEDVRETLHENGADMLDSARKVIAALDGTA